MKVYTTEEWRKEGLDLYGTDNILEWPLVCPNCDTVQKGQELIDLGMSKNEALGFLGFSCIGRFKGAKKGCDWTLGGLFQLHEAEIHADDDGKLIKRQIFKFSKNDEQK